MSIEPPKPVVADRYRMIEQIGRGGMGSVWRAEHTSLRTPVAIKLLNPKLANNASLRARFLREAQSAAALQSVHIVRILDHGVDDDLPYIAMEYLRGESLRTRLARTGRLSPAAAAPVFAGVCRGMARAHRAGIVHRDLKPDNVFLTQDDELGEIAKVVDFGIAKLLDDAKLGGDDPTEGVATQTGTVLGTPYYMSPEQLRGRKEIDARSDLWSIAVIAYEVLLGKRPFVAEAIGELVLVICSSPPPIPSSIGSVPAGFDAWFARAVQLEPDDRFQTVHELAKGLAAILSPGEPWLPAEPEATSSASGESRPRLVARLTPATGPSVGAPGAAPVDEPTQTSADAKPEAEAIDARSGGVPPSADAQGIASATHSTHEVSTTSPKRGGVGLYAGVTAAVLALGGGAYALRGNDAPAAPGSTTSAPEPSPTSPPSVAMSTAAAPSASAQPSATASAAVEPTVSITFETTPPGAEVVVDGKKLGQSPEPVALDRGDQEVTIVLRKPGYVTKAVKVTPDGSRTIQVELVRAVRPSDALD